MPNGVDANYRRLLMACASYREKFGEWPTYARIDFAFLQDLASLFDAANFKRLAERLELRIQTEGILAVGGPYGEVRYDGPDFSHSSFSPATVDEADRWLDVMIRRDLEGH